MTGRRLVGRRPLAVRAAASAVTAALVDVAVVFGVPVSPPVKEAVVAAVVAAAMLYTVVAGQRKVTPVADPRAGDGMPLVPRGG